MAATDSADGEHLASLGYKQHLERSVGRFGSFAAGISYISILTGTFQLFYFGFGAGGPAYWWSWPAVFAGQLMVALCFGEPGARSPVAGSGSHWSQRRGRPTGCGPAEGGAVPRRAGRALRGRGLGRQVVQAAGQRDGVLAGRLDHAGGLDR